MSFDVAQLGSLLNTRRWLRHDQPFPFVTAANVFTQPFYAELEAAFQNALLGGLFAPPSKKKLPNDKRPHYDAFVASLHTSPTDALGLFASKSWHDILASLFDVETSNDAQIALHHHPAGSPSGWIHTDLSLRWFADRHDPDSVNLSCAGLKVRSTRNVRPAIRAVAMLFYLNNNWSRGSGGETNLYRTVRDRIDNPATSVPPVNNSLLAFECTPASFHAFASNRRHPRNSVNLWLYRTKDSAIARWGKDAIFDAAD